MNGEQSYNTGYSLGMSGASLSYPAEYVDAFQYNLGYSSGLLSFQQDQQISEGSIISQVSVSDSSHPTYADGYGDGLLGKEKRLNNLGMYDFSDYNTGYDAGYSIYSKNNLTSPENIINPTYADGYADGMAGKVQRQGGVTSDFSNYDDGYNDGYTIYLQTHQPIIPFVNNPTYAEGYAAGFLGQAKLVLTGSIISDFSEYNNGYNDGYAIYLVLNKVQQDVATGTDTTSLQNSMYKNGYDDAIADSSEKGKNFFVNPQDKYYDFYSSGYDAGKVVYQSKQSNTIVGSKQSVSPILIIGIVLAILYISK